MKKYLVGIVLCMLTKSALAGLMLDQSFVPSETGAQGSSVLVPSIIQAQSFTVGVDGKLARVDLYVHLFFSNILPVDNLTFNLLETDANGVPIYTSSLASLSIAASQLSSGWNSFITLDLMEFEIQVLEGDILALSLERGLERSLDTFVLDYGWRIAADDPYVGGNLFVSPDLGSNFFPTGSPSGTGDVGFKTYVYVSEPSIFLMLGLGLILLILQRKHMVFNKKL